MYLMQQSRSLYGLSSTAIFERFAYYAVHCTLVLFLMHHFSMSSKSAYELFGAFTAFMYLMTPIGGYCADRWLGTNVSIILGALLLGIGYFLMGFSGELNGFHLGLATVAVGNGFFQPTIAMAVGQLYEEKEDKREIAFMIFYAAINVGAVLPPLLIGWLFGRMHQQHIYTLSAVLVFVSIFVFGSVIKTGLLKASFGMRNISSLIFCFLSAMFFILVVDFALQKTHLANLCLLVVALFFTVYVLLKSFDFMGREKNNLLVCILLIAFSVLFWAMYQQKAMSLMVFSQALVDRTLLHHQILPQTFLALNPLLIVIFTPVVARLWRYLSVHYQEPSIIVKFGLGIILVGMSFLVLDIGVHFSDVTAKLPVGWLVLSYTLITLGELCISPVGLAMITAYAPVSMRGVMMGLWYLASAAAFSLSSFISDWSVADVAMANAKQVQAHYLPMFFGLGVLALSVGFLLSLFSKWLRFV